MQIKDQQGFTLIELMMVIVIIGILIAIAQPIYQQAKSGAERTTCQNNQRVMEGAIGTWKAMNSESNYPVDADVISTLTSQGYLKSTPICPAGGAYEAHNGGGTTTPTITCTKPEHSY